MENRDGGMEDRDGGMEDRDGGMENRHQLVPVPHAQWTIILFFGGHC